MRIRNAKVSESAVRAFCKSVQAAGDYSSKFDKGINCLKRIITLINEYNNDMVNCIKNMEEALDRLDKKIEEIKHKIQELDKELKQYNSELQSLSNFI